MTTLYQIRDGTGIIGPFSSAEVRQLAEDGTLHPRMEIRRLPDGNWSPLAKVDGLRFKSPLGPIFERRPISVV